MKRPETLLHRVCYCFRSFKCEMMRNTQFSGRRPVNPHRCVASSPPPLGVAMESVPGAYVPRPGMPAQARHAGTDPSTVEAASAPPDGAEVGRNQSDDFESRLPPFDPLMPSSCAPAIHGGARRPCLTFAH